MFYLVDASAEMGDSCLPLQLWCGAHRPKDSFKVSTVVKSKNVAIDTT
jgi:hypothetical protein